MENNTVYDISLTADEALHRTQIQLNSAVSDFDKWISTNPLQANRKNDEYRIRQQHIKVLKLKLREIAEMRDTFRETLTLLSSSIDLNTLNTLSFTKSKSDNVSVKNDTMRIADKRCNRVSNRSCVDSLNPFNE